MPFRDLHNFDQLDVHKNIIITSIIYYIYFIYSFEIDVQSWKRYKKKSAQEVFFEQNLTWFWNWASFCLTSLSSESWNLAGVVTANFWLLSDLLTTLPWTLMNWKLRNKINMGYNSQQSNHFDFELSSFPHYNVGLHPEW